MKSTFEVKEEKVVEVATLSAFDFKLKENPRAEKRRPKHK